MVLLYNSMILLFYFFTLSFQLPAIYIIQRSGVTLIYNGPSLDFVVFISLGSGFMLAGVLFYLRFRDYIIPVNGCIAFIGPIITRLSSILPILGPLGFSMHFYVFLMDFFDYHFFEDVESLFLFNFIV